ncbi:MAG: hypothetical protein LBN19_01185 [Endomicrobium sp.]|nr:hypothetical protein [Endomicrobium sp.]
MKKILLVLAIYVTPNAGVFIKIVSDLLVAASKRLGIVYLLIWDCSQCV